MSPTKSNPFKIELLDGALGARIMRLSGPLTLQTLFEFQTAARREASRSLVIDIAKVLYMDSAGLGCLISVFASCQKTNRGFGVIGVTDRVRTLLEVTHVDGLLPCFDSLDAAEAAVMKSKA